MELSRLFISVKKPPNLFAKPCFAFYNPSESKSIAEQVALSRTLQTETLKTLEWSSVCKKLSKFTSTSMGFSVAQSAQVPIGRTQKESQKLLDQTSAARLIPRPIDFSGIDDLTDIVNVATSGQLLTIRELCTVCRTLRAARGLFNKLQELSSVGSSSERDSVFP